MPAENRRLSVLIVTPRFRPDRGGVETVVERAAEELTRAGVEVTVLTAARKGDRRETLSCRDGSYKVRRSRLLWGQSCELPLQLFGPAFSETRRHDVVHVHSYHALSALIATLAAGRRPIVFTPHYHGTGHTGLRSLLHHIYRPLGRLVFRRASVVYANSEAEAGLLRRDHGDLLDGKLRVLWNGVSIPARPEAPLVSGPRPRVLSVSRLEPYKRVDLLIAATLLEEQKSSATGWDLIVVGEGHDRSRLEGLAQGSPRVMFTGRLSDEELANWWFSCDVFASASEQESFGLGVAQALASGLRCVASDIPAHREIVATVGSGFLVAGNDPQGWVETLTAALKDEPSAAAIPGWDHVAGTLSDAYRELLVRS